MKLQSSNAIRNDLVGPFYDPTFSCYTNIISSNTPTSTSVVQAYVSYKKLQKMQNFWNP